MEKYKISSLQLTFLIIGFLFGSSGIISPATSARQDAWLAFLIGWVGGFLLIGVCLAIAKLNPSKTLVEILKSNFGALIGSIIAIFYIFYFIHLASIVLRNFGEFINIVTHPNTPMLFIIACMAIVCAYALRKGVEVLGRTSEMLVPLLPITLTVAFIGASRLFDITNFEPALINGWKPVIPTIFSVISFPFGETIVFLTIFTYLNKKKNLNTSVLTGTLIAGLFLLTILMRDTMALGVEAINRATFPTELASKLVFGINIYPIILVNLLIGGFIKITVCLYTAITSTAELIKLSDHKVLILPITAFTVVLSVWVYQNVLEMFAFADIYPYYAIPFQIIIPALLLAISIIKKILNKS